MERYYHIQLLFDTYLNSINNDQLLNIADSISKVTGCNYKTIEYYLYHPDYADKNLGHKYPNNRDVRASFIREFIPSLYFGKKEIIPSAPTISFYNTVNDKSYHDYEICLTYPSYSGYTLEATVDLREKDIMDHLFIDLFIKIVSIFEDNGFSINNGYADYFSGNRAKWRFSGIKYSPSFLTIRDRQIIDHVNHHRKNWRETLVDVFYVNCIIRKAFNDETLNKLKELVGDNNCIVVGDIIVFQIPISPKLYLIIRWMPVIRPFNRIKKHLIDSYLCQKDTSIIRLILDI